MRRYASLYLRFNMPELPEIKHLAYQMEKALAGKTIAGADILNPKCLNMGADEFVRAVAGKTVRGADSKGKWVMIRLEGGDCLALNLNMGGNVVLFGPGLGPREKWRVNLKFTDGCSLSVGFWFLGYLHYVEKGQAHPMTDGLGADPLADGFSYEAFDALLGGRKVPVKTLLLRQDVIAGIGNYYIQDLLFLARVHPMKPVASLSGEEKRRIYESMRSYLQQALDMGGAWYENGLDDQPGGYREMLIGYKEGQPCPVCGTSIKKIKTGSTSGFVCEVCQPL
jgi:formamidopyrimidine-DNA glycosylase